MPRSGQKAAKKKSGYRRVSVAFYLSAFWSRLPGGYGCRGTRKAAVILRCGLLEAEWSAGRLCQAMSSHLPPRTNIPEIPGHAAMQRGWPVFRYGLAELELKKQTDGEPAATTLASWALRYRFTQAGTPPPLSSYTYAEQAPPDETVP